MATYLITGANRGIGYELCRQLKAAHETVIAVCRRSSAQLEALNVQVEVGIDIASASQVADLAKRLKGTPINVLINNAGILEVSSLGDLDFDAIRQQFEVNAMGPLRVTEALLPNLTAGAKVALVTSRMGSIDDNSSGGFYGYRMSKVALSMAGKSLAIDLERHDIAVAILHPGMVSTDMTGQSGIPPAKAAKGLLARIQELNMDNTGTFWHANGEELPW